MGRLYQKRHNNGECKVCGRPVPVNLTTGRRPWECDICKKNYAEHHRNAVNTYRARRRARGECVQCGRAVTTKNPRTGLPTTRCTPCARLQSKVQQRIAKRNALPELARAS